MPAPFTQGGLSFGILLFFESLLLEEKVVAERPDEVERECMVIT